MQNDASSFTAALRCAKEAFETVKEQVRQANYQLVWGTSGTIDAVDSVLKANEWEQQGITLAGLRKLQQSLLLFPKTNEIDLLGLRSDRATIFPAGIAILTAAFETLGIQNMTVVGAALREGVLFELALSLGLR